MAMLRACFLAAVITGASTVRIIRRKRAARAEAITLSNVSAVFENEPWTPRALDAEEPKIEPWMQEREEPPKAPHAGENGLVDYIYTFGASGTANPALQNQRGDEPCFNGLRTYLTQEGRLWGRNFDAVAYIAHPAGLYHSQYPVRELEVGRPDKYPECRGCSTLCVKPLNGTPISNMPQRGTSSWALHRSERYRTEVRRIGNEWFTNMTDFATVYAYNPSNSEVADLVRQRGWRLIGYASEAGSGFSRGPQVAYLLQQDDTLDCTVTFQGTASIRDWGDNLNSGFERFCGLADQDESCRLLPWRRECTMRHPRGAFVHRGFANRLRAIASSSEWKDMIKPMLPFCKKVSAVGHSLGGALAELFTTCVSKEMQPGQYGYEDHELFAWKISESGPHQMETAKYAKEHMGDKLFGDALLGDLAANVHEAKDAVHDIVESAMASDGAQ